ncbi:hypothetical protein TrLO_g11647 [Triparma laevis f. longispina]|uniref:histidine kinase n=1 Tax=Triparma laevis f. longispina TaxID=1714387 RepID=A0A9W7CJ28_9STRA|nr:hypothetical protein TrLO_g11647 [Triparma laevis f. longispina]
MSVQDMLTPSVRKGVEFTCNFGGVGTDLWVLADSHRLQQVYTNVVTNAIKYTLEGKIELVFWFVQCGGAPGTGLGLAIAKHLVDLTGGSIKFVSDPSVKPGTDCIVTIPFIKCSPVGVKPVEVKIQDVIKEKLSFLIIDDITVNRTLLRKRILKNSAPIVLLIVASKKPRTAKKP